MSLQGVGLHTGRPAAITLSPAPADSGIVFRAGDPHGTMIPAGPGTIVDSRSATTLGLNGSRVQTVEHLLAAAAALGIDNLLVEVEGEEIPAMDGSALPFVSLIRAAGTETLPAPRRPIAIREPIRVGDDTRWILAVPAPELRVSYTLDVDHPAVGTQAASFSCTEAVLVEEVAPARTYGFLRDVGTMRKNGLARGGSLDNAVVVGRRTVLNRSLRYRDEFVRHKVLDLLGDLALLGRPLSAHVIARNAGHALNHQLVRAIEREACRAPELGAPAGAPSAELPRPDGGRELLSGIAAL